MNTFICARCGDVLFKGEIVYVCVECKLLFCEIDGELQIESNYEHGNNYQCDECANGKLKRVILE